MKERRTEGDVGTFYEIRVPKGTKAVITNEGEREYVLAPGARLHVVESYHDIDIEGVNYKNYYVAEYLPEDVEPSQVVRQALRGEA